MKASQIKGFSISCVFLVNVSNVLILSLLIAGAVLGQEHRVQGKQQARPTRSINYGNWVGRRVMTKEFMEKVGITDEQAAKFKTLMDETATRQKTLEAEIHKLSIKQAQIAKKVLNEPGADTAEIMEIIENIGKLRTEQAKNNTKILIHIRDTLTEEQRKKASEAIAEEGNRRIKEQRHQRRPRDARERRDPGAPPRPTAPQDW